MRAGGAGDGEALRGGVCDRGEGDCGTGNGFSFLECLSPFLDSFSEEPVPDDDWAFFSPLSFLWRFSY